MLLIKLKLGEVKHPISVCSSGSDPGWSMLCCSLLGWLDRKCGGVSWGFTHPRGCTCNRLWEGALQDWAAQWHVWCDVYKHQLPSCYLRGQSIETGPLVPIPSLAGREPSPSPDFLTWLLSLWTPPVTSLCISHFCSKTRTSGQSVSKRFCCCSEMSAMTLITKGSASSAQHPGTT